MFLAAILKNRTSECNDTQLEMGLFQNRDFLWRAALPGKFDCNPTPPPEPPPRIWDHLNNPTAPNEKQAKGDVFFPPKVLSAFSEPR